MWATSVAAASSSSAIEIEGESGKVLPCLGAGKRANSHELNALGVEYQQSARYDFAEACYRAALRKKPPSRPCNERLLNLVCSDAVNGTEECDLHRSHVRSALYGLARFVRVAANPPRSLLCLASKPTPDPRCQGSEW